MGIQTEERANRLGTMAEGTVSAQSLAVKSTKRAADSGTELGKLSIDSFLSFL